MRIFSWAVLGPVLFIFLLTGCSSIPESTIVVKDPQLKCLAEAIHGEARGEPSAGRVFVGRVVLTRVKMGFASSICGVVYAPSQFAPRRDFNQSSLSSAREALRYGPNGITHFHSYKKQRTPAASFSVSNQCKFKLKVGGHWGYTCFEGRGPASAAR